MGEDRAVLELMKQAGKLRANAKRYEKLIAEKESHVEDLRVVVAGIRAAVADVESTIKVLRATGRGR